MFLVKFAVDFFVPDEAEDVRVPARVDRNRLHVLTCCCAAQIVNHRARQDYLVKVLVLDAEEEAEEGEDPNMRVPVSENASLEGRCVLLPRHAPVCNLVRRLPIAPTLIPTGQEW